MGGWHQHRDQDADKGAVEADHATDSGREGSDSPGLDDNGLPDDPVAIAEDVVGANEDETQG